MKKNLIFIISAALFALSVFLISQLIAQAQLEDIAFPVPELGDCTSKDDCKNFCDKPENFSPCIAFAEKHNLISKEEAEKARLLAEAGITSGPGSCRGDAECDAFCSQPANMEECILFAEEHNLMPPEELAEAKQVLQAIKSGASLPGGCTNKESCEVYCQEPAHTEECVAFAETAGFINPKEAAMIRKTGGQGPGNCRGKEACEGYCEGPTHFEECLAFAEEHGLIDPEEVRMARLTGGVGPGNCRGKEECQTYCDDISHMEECIDFGVQIGEMSPEEAEQAKKMAKMGITSGPGGCQGKNECETFCNDPANMESCIDFAVQIGEMSPEEAEQAKKMGPAMMAGGPGGCQGREECETFCEDPAHGEECMKFALENGMMTEEEYQMVQQMGEAIMTGGPGGCKSEEECKDYCDDPAHGEECLNFAVKTGQMSPEEAETMKEGGPERTMPQGQMPEERFGPGGCQTEEECLAYCSDPAHSQECGGGPGPKEEPRPGAEEPFHPESEGTPLLPPEQQQEPMPYPDGSIPSENQEQIQQQMEQEMQRQIEEQTQQQMEQYLSPPSTEQTPPPPEQPSPPPSESVPPAAKILNAFNSLWQTLLKFFSR